MSSTTKVKTLFVTLRRGLAGGTTEKTIKILQSLNLTKTNSVREVPNTPDFRGALAKIIHMVTIETDTMYHARQQAHKQHFEHREPLRVSHTTMDGVTAPVASRQEFVDALWHSGAKEGVIHRSKTSRESGEQLVKALGSAKKQK